MSAKEYNEAYPYMTELEHDLMYDLYYSENTTNHDGHTWVTYGDVERIVGTIIQERYKEMTEREQKLIEILKKAISLSDNENVPAFILQEYIQKNGFLSNDAAEEVRRLLNEGLQKGKRISSEC